jgi:hypothetical protein
MRLHIYYYNCVSESVHPEKKIAVDLAVTLKIKAYEETVVAKAKLEGTSLFTILKN